MINVNTIETRVNYNPKMLHVTKSCNLTYGVERKRPLFTKCGLSISIKIHFNLTGQKTILCFFTSLCRIFNFLVCISFRLLNKLTKQIENDLDCSASLVTEQIVQPVSVEVRHSETSIIRKVFPRTGEQFAIQYAMEYQVIFSVTSQSNRSCNK